LANLFGAFFSLKVKKVVAYNKSASSHGNKDINTLLSCGSSLIMHSWRDPFQLTWHSDS